MLDMFGIKNNQTIYTLSDNDFLEPVNPYLLPLISSLGKYYLYPQGNKPCGTYPTFSIYLILYCSTLFFYVSYSANALFRWLLMHRG